MGNKRYRFVPQLRVRLDFERRCELQYSRCCNILYIYSVLNNCNFMPLRAADLLLADW